MPVALSRPLVVGVAVLLVAGCGGSASHSAKAASSTSAPSKSRGGTSAAASTTALDEALAMAVITQPRDLPSGWAVAQDDPLRGDQLNSPPDKCDPTGLFSQHTAGRHREWSYLLQPDGTESGHLVVLAKVARTADVVTRQLALIGSAVYRPCEAQGIESDLVRAGATAVGTTTSAPLEMTLPVPGGAQRYSTPYQFDGVNKVMYTDLIWIGLGRVRVVISPRSCCKPPSHQLEDALIASVTARVRTASVG